MSGAPDLPLWAALLVSFLVLSGALITLIGSVGLLRLPDFYARTHAPSLGATLGTGCILIGSMIAFSVLQTRFLVHELLIAAFVTLTTPVTLMLLARAALYRDRVERTGSAPDTDPEPTELS
ncbi:monovalent cation/H(+) antiporter subunit G [Ancylobacter pratisalsi]|uniref:Cation:proton antiporter n=1 Tax=Ancylobacter pratisalsi TaxID=1745854 RepID=A0A6P1YHE4_9HYPH|nr:monovalent cation/H(+) antiporter subunit G [Ancylobacter pratisalsi]QIB32718.1 cation:proton antiporter [Ancylobacter pratisalsi]